jgi:PAS domain S-box-containing protein
VPPTSEEDSGFRAILDRQPNAVLVQEGGQVRYANAALASLLGYPGPEALVGKAMSELESRHVVPSSPDSPPVFVPNTTTLGCRLLRCDGSLIVAQCREEHILFDGQQGAVLFLRDITDPIRTLEALKHSEQNFRALLEASPNATCVCSTDHITYANAAMVEFLGYHTADPLLRPTLAELSDQIIYPGDRDRTRDAFRKLFSSLGGSGKPTNEVVRIADIRLRRRSDGALRICDMYGVIVLQNDAPALVAYLQDLTDHKYHEERMRLADRMSSLGTLAAGIAHEINNPLAYVIANVEFIAKRIDLAGGAELAGPLSAVRVGLDRMRKIVLGLKTFSRRDEETIGPVDVVQVIESCVEIAQSQLRHTCRLTRDYGDVPHALGNDARLGQVFLNLLVNASQSFDERQRERNQIHVAVSRSDQTIVVEVRDNGCGIPPADLPRVFDPFFTSKPIGKGTGLGLSVCHGIVTALGGEIGIESAVGEGTIVRVSLKAAHGVASGTKAPTRARGRRGRILVVDDDRLLLEAVRRTLEEEHDVVAVPTGRDALDLLEAGTDFDVILCDVVMPGINGEGLWTHIASAAPELASRVVFLTAGAVTESTEALLQGTTNAVLTKPFEPSELLGFVRSRVGT